MRAALAGMVVVWAACDPRATASGSAGRSDQRSHEYETCSASTQCQDDLRCFDHACRRTARSTVGDYFAAAGAFARSRGDLEAAIAAYAQALAHYDADKVALPPDVDCAYGAALAAARTKRDHAELGARVLHRCLLAAPAGSRLRDQALADLATLGDAGLDPVLLGANKLADLYLTKRPARPSSENLAVSVTAQPMPTGKSFPQIPATLGAPELRSSLVACWEAYTAAAHRDALTVTLGLKSSFTPSEYEDEAGTFATRLDPPALPPGGPEAAADACVRAVVEPAIKAVKLSDAFTTHLAITIK
jgi:hypothetical protein